MKTLIKLSLVIFLLSTITTGCKKYVDGPGFSLLTKKARLTGDWKIEQKIIDGHDITVPATTGSNANFLFSIKKDETYTLKTDSISDSGKWVFGEDKDDVYFTSNAAGSTEQAFRILRLKNTELWLRSTAPNGVQTIIHFKQ